MAVMGANAIGNLPITIGGSGLAEYGIMAYLNNLNPFDYSITEEILALECSNWLENCNILCPNSNYVATISKISLE